MKKLLAFFLFLCSISGYCQYDFKVADSVLASYNKPGSPGATVLVRKGGQVLYQKSGGYANIEKGELITDKTVFNLASDTKQFTAACVILLQQKGKLKLDDKLAKYFPDFPEYAQKITIQDLLNHTAGLKDYRNLMWIAGKKMEECSNEDIRKVLRRNSPDFEPGSSWSYSNSGYWFLVQIVEQVSGKPIAKFAEDNIFKPLNLRDTRYHRGVAKLKNAASGYKLQEGKYIECDADTGVFGGSGMYSTANDMVKWLDEMHTHRVLGNAFWDAMLNGFKKELAADSFYSNGLDFKMYQGKKWIYHGGDLYGYHSIMSYFPEENLNIIVFTNTGDFKVIRMQNAIASHLFGFKYQWPTAEKPAAVQLPKETLETYAGIYQSEDMYIEIIASNNAVNVTQLWDGSSYDVPPTGQAAFTFALAGADFLFEDIVDGKAQVMKLTQGGEALGFKRTNDYKWPDYSAYGGRYRCKSIDVDFDFYTKGGKFFYAINGVEVAEVGVIEKDVANIDKGELTFQKNEQGVITGFTLNHVRVKNLEFEKI